jgi:dTDP-D-glucose 4,6-dehydratase
MSKKELTDLKSDILDMQRELKTLVRRMDEMTVFFENHGHVDQRITGPSIFLQELYDQKIKQAQQQQGQPAQQPPVLVPEEPEEKTEE